MEKEKKMKYESRLLKMGEYNTTMKTQGEAFVFSSNADISGNIENIREKLKYAMERIVAAVEDNGGIVGHVKASVKSECTEIYSITDVLSGIHTVIPDKSTVIVNLVVIMYGIEKKKAIRLLEMYLK